MSRIACDVQGASVRHGSRIRLHETSVQIKESTVTAIVGANGSGKSTLLSVMSGEIAIRAGIVRLFDQDITSVHSHELARIRAVLDQKTPTTFAFTVRDVVSWGRFAWRSMPERLRDADVIDACLARLNLQELSDRSIQEISAGELSRVHLARVLAQEAPIVMLDEADADLDLSARMQLDGVVRTLRDQGSTVIMVTHDLSRVNSLADQVIGVRSGRVAYLDRTLNTNAVADLFDVSREEATRALRD